jgi:hypothetical protein
MINETYSTIDAREKIEEKFGKIQNYLTLVPDKKNVFRYVDPKSSEEYLVTFLTNRVNKGNYFGSIYLKSSAKKMSKSLEGLLIAKGFEKVQRF